MLPQHRTGNGHPARGRHPGTGGDWVRTWAGLLILIFVLALMWEISVIGASSGGHHVDGIESSLLKMEQRLKGELSRHMEETRKLGGSAELDLANARIADLERVVQAASAGSGDNNAAWQQEVNTLSKELAEARQAAAQVSQLRGDVDAAKAEAAQQAGQVQQLQQELARKDEELTRAAASGGSMAVASQAAVADVNVVSQLAWDKSAWYADKPGKLLTPYVWREPLPPLVKAWHEGKLDWHDLIPHHSAVWERFGESRDDKFNFMKLVMKEEMVTDYLTQYKDSGLAANFGKDFGPMRNLSACNQVDDPCLVHGRVDCDRNSFCKWDDKTRSCHEAPEGHTEPCRNGRPTKLSQMGRPVEAHPGDCKRYIHERVFIERVQDDPAAMFYHWWRYFREVFGRVRNRGGLDKMNHFLMERPPNTQFFHYFGLLSNFCWRRYEHVPQGTCFCEEDTSSSVHGHTDMQDHLLHELQLSHLSGTPSKVTVGLISRRRKRFILNEHALVSTLLDMGLDVQILPLEEMTLYEQIKALRQTTILVGIHGSGLNNAILLPHGAVLIQLLPYKLNYKGAFAQVARDNEVSYIEWGLEDPSLSYFHWEFLGQRELANGKEAVLRRGSPRGGAEVYTFWINQDIIVPIDEFTRLIQNALRTGINARLQRH